MTRLFSLFAAYAAFLLSVCDGFLIGIDLGSQFFKAAVVAPGKPFEVVHNTHSKRKTPTAVSFQEAVRTFGDDALASANRGVEKTPTFFPLQLGRNATDLSDGQLNWLPTRYYPYNLAVNSSGSIVFQMGEEGYTVEEATGHLLSFAKGLAEATVDGIAATEAIITIPSSATMVQRQALLSAARIAGLPKAQLIHETAAAALQRALDVDLGGASKPSVNGSDPVVANKSVVLFYNMGARHVEACVVEYEGATHQGKNTVSLSVLGCGVSEKLGGHKVDIIIADKMLAAFKEKYPKLSDIEKSARALKKLEKQAVATKHVLSANKEAQFRVEALYEDTDFMHAVSRDDVESWSSDLFSNFKEPIEAALALANVTLDSFDGVEMIGGGWRIPKVQTMLSEYLKEQRAENAPILNLSQHVNGDEAMATGAAFFGANSSVSFRTKKIFFSDFTTHSYALVLKPSNSSQAHEDDWERGVELFPAQGKLKSKKTVKLNVTFDLKATLLENGNPIVHWLITGINDASTGQFAELEAPLVSLKLDLDSSGVVQLSSATAIFNELVTVELSPPKAIKTALNATEDTPASNESEEQSESSKEAEDASDEENAPATSNVSEESTNSTTKQTKVKKRKIPLEVVENYDGISPRPLSADELKQARQRLLAMDAYDADVRRADAAKNALEGAIYEYREKLGSDENVLTVSTEDERTEASGEITQMEEWLYEDEARNANASTLEEKLKFLQEKMYPILMRAWELEQRATIPDLVQKVKDYANATLDYVVKNMTWVAEKEVKGVSALIDELDSWYANVTENQSTLALTENPAYSVNDVKRRLQRIQSEAQRLTKIRKIDPMPYSDSRYGGYGKGDFWKDPKMREFYEQYYRNFSKNGTNFSDMFRNFSNFNRSRDDNESDYMKSFRDFYGGDSNSTADEDPSDGAKGTASDNTKSEL